MLHVYTICHKERCLDISGVSEIQICIRQMPKTVDKCRHPEKRRKSDSFPWLSTFRFFRHFSYMGGVKRIAGVFKIICGLKTVILNGKLWRDDNGTWTIERSTGLRALKIAAEFHILIIFLIFSRNSTFSSDSRILITSLILAENSKFRVHIPKINHVILKFAFESFNPKF